MDGIYVLVAVICVASAILFGSLGFSTGRATRRGLRYETGMALVVSSAVLAADVVYMHNPAFYAVCGGWLLGFLLGKVLPRRG